MNDKLLSSLKKLAVASAEADEKLARGIKQAFDAIEERTKSNTAERDRIKENISRGARLSKHRFTL